MQYNVYTSLLLLLHTLLGLGGGAYAEAFQVLVYLMLYLGTRLFWCYFGVETKEGAGSGQN